MQQRILTPCWGCGKPKKKHRYVVRAHIPRGLCNECYRARLKTPHYGERRPSKMQNGYMRRFHPEHRLSDRQGLVYVHREVWFDAHGAIPDGHHIHHLNGDRADNRLENLELIDRSEHSRRHAHERGYVINQYGAWRVGTGIARQAAVRKAAADKRNCSECEADITHLRLDAVVCGDTCRVRRFRRLRQIDLTPNC